MIELSKTYGFQQYFMENEENVIEIKYVEMQVHQIRVDANVRMILILSSDRPFLWMGHCSKNLVSYLVVQGMSYLQAIKLPFQKEKLTWCGLLTIHNNLNYKLL